MSKIIKLPTLKRSLPHLISSVPSSQFLSESQRRSVLRHLPEGQMKLGTSATSHLWPENKKSKYIILGSNLLNTTRYCAFHKHLSYFLRLQLSAVRLTVYTKNAIVSDLKHSCETHRCLKNSTRKLGSCKIQTH